MESTGDNNDGLVNGIPRHLCGDGFEMPDAPPLSPEEEKELVKKMIEIRSKAFDPINPKTGKEYTPQTKARHVARYENMKHFLIVRYSFVVQKEAANMCNQCQKGMGYDDLCSVGWSAISNVIDSWPPFLGKKDKGYRLLTSMRIAVKNAICRFLDTNSRTIQIPSHRHEQLVVRLKADNIKYGKRSKNGKRKGQGPFEKAVVNMLNDLDMDIDSVDGKSLADIAIETGEYRAVADVVGLDVDVVIAIIDPTTSIDTPVDDGDGEETVGGMLEFEEQDSEFYSYRREVIEEALDHIAERNAQILRDHWFAQMSIGEIAEKYGFTKVRAGQLLHRSIRQILSNRVSVNILNHKLLGKNMSES